MCDPLRFRTTSALKRSGSHIRALMLHAAGLPESTGAVSVQQNLFAGRKYNRPARLMTACGWLSRLQLEPQHQHEPEGMDVTLLFSGMILLYKSLEGCSFEALSWSLVAFCTLCTRKCCLVLCSRSLLV